MIKCTNCNQEYNESLAAGICPHCGNTSNEVMPITEAFFPWTQVDADQGKNQPGQSFEDPRWLPVGTILNSRYRVTKVIGSGGFGITYQVWDTQNRVHKAVKEYFQQGVVNRIPGTTEVLISAPKRREEFEYGRERLLNEAQIVAKFQSPSIVRVDDYFEENNTAYMVMEYLECPTLEEYIFRRKKVLDINQAIDVGVHICEALEEIHQAGVVHRDISPDNVFITDEGTVKIKIIDFGSARLSREDFDDRLIVLKPGFAPPEQYEKIDPANDRQKSWTDVYALGATLYLCLTGQVPAEASDRKADFDTNSDRVCYPHKINPNIPMFLSNAIMTAMAINIHERFQNATEMKAALLQEREVLPVEVVRKKKRIKRTVGIGASVALILVLAVTGIWRYFERKSDVVLDAAVVSVWYSVADNQTLVEQKNKAFEMMKNELLTSDKFSEIQVELKAIDEKEYVACLEEAYAKGSMPTIFECVDSDAMYMSETEEIDDVLDLIAADSCYFLQDYDRYFSDKIKVPMGFNVPVIYINTALIADCPAELTVNTMEDLMVLADGEMMYKPMAVNEKLKENYGKMFADFERYADNMNGHTVQDFLEGNAVVYFSDTSDYYTVRNALQSSFSMISIDTEHVICEFCDYWSIGACDGNTEIAAKEILAYFFTNNIQDQYYVQTNLPGLPVEKVAVKDFAWVTRSIAGLLEDCSGYTFEKQ